jgi:predicted DCC family thiol-disulfide oxidoreductase YuxK
MPLSEKKTIDRSGADPQIIYDGDCPICRTFIRKIRQRRSGENIRYVASQELNLGDRKPSIKPEILSKSVVYIDGRGRVFNGIDAISRILRRRRGVAAILGAIIAWPGIRRVAGFGYFLFTKYRYKISSMLGLK